LTDGVKNANKSLSTARSEEKTQQKCPQNGNFSILATASKALDGTTDISGSKKEKNGNLLN